MNLKQNFSKSKFSRAMQHCCSFFLFIYKTTRLSDWNWAETYTWHICATTSDVEFLFEFSYLKMTTVSKFENGYMTAHVNSSLVENNSSSHRIIQLFDNNGKTVVVIDALTSIWRLCPFYMFGWVALALQEQTNQQTKSFKQNNGNSKKNINKLWLPWALQVFSLNFS